MSKGLLQKTTPILLTHTPPMHTHTHAGIYTCAHACAHMRTVSPHPCSGWPACRLCGGTLPRTSTLTPFPLLISLNSLPSGQSCGVHTAPSCPLWCVMRAKHSVSGLRPSWCWDSVHPGEEQLAISPRGTAGYCPAGVVDKGRRAGRHAQCPLEPVALPRAWPRLSPLRGPGWSRGEAGIAWKLFCHDGSCAGTDGASESPRLREKPLQGSMEIKELCLISGGPLCGARGHGSGRKGSGLPQTRVLPRWAGPLTDPFSLPLQGQGGQAQTLCFETIITMTWAAWERSLVSRMQVCGPQALEPLLPVAVPQRQPSPQPLQRPTPCSHAPHTQIHTHPHTYTHAHPIRVKTPNHMCTCTSTRTHKHTQNPSHH